MEITKLTEDWTGEPIYFLFEGMYVLENVFLQSDKPEEECWLFNKKERTKDQIIKNYAKINDIVKNSDPDHLANLNLNWSKKLLSYAPALKFASFATEEDAIIAAAAFYDLAKEYGALSTDDKGCSGAYFVNTLRLIKQVGENHYINVLDTWELMRIIKTKALVPTSPRDGKIFRKLIITDED